MSARTIRAPRGPSYLQGLASGSRPALLMNNLDPEVAEKPDS
jgi:urocanate hydratase